MANFKSLIFIGRSTKTKVAQSLLCESTGDLSESSAHLYRLACQHGTATVALAIALGIAQAQMKIRGVFV